MNLNSLSESVSELLEYGVSLVYFFFIDQNRMWENVETTFRELLPQEAKFT